jgi:glyceraldehyde 3-phosphate dehydrogenase
MGVNEAMLKPGAQIISNASCTTNCVAPVAKVLDEAFGIERGLMTTIHAYTNDQNILDLPHKDLRRARRRGALDHSRPRPAPRAPSGVLPALKGKLDGVSMRVPVPDGSMIDLVCVLKKKVTIDEVNKAFRRGAKKR